jgi:hypothetical protein
MSRSPEQENFEELRRLLALKRHEQPPPGYFHDFSRQVIARIKAGEADLNGSLWSRIVGQGSLLRNLWEGFEAKPIIAGVFGVGVCGLLVFGLVSSERTDSNPNALSPAPGGAQTFFAKVPTQQTVGTSLYENAAAVTGAVFKAQSGSSIFEEIQRPHFQAQPITYSAPGN